MTTRWLSTTGSNSLDGLTYANAKLTIRNLLTGVTTGDIVNVVNDGTYPWPTVEGDTPVGLAGTNFGTGYGLLIRGTDSAGNPALTTYAPAGAGIHFWIRVVAGGKYIIVRNLLFDASSQSGDAAQYVVVRMRDTGTPDPGPVRIEGCSLVAAASAGTPSGNRLIFAIDTTAPPAASPIYEIEDCYFQNCGALFASLGATLVKSFVGNLIIKDGASTSIANLAQTLAAGTGGTLSFNNNTIFKTVGSNQLVAPLSYGVGAALNAGTVNVYSNVLFQDSTHANPNIQFMSDNTGTGTFAGTINNNILLGGPNVAAGDLDPKGWYENTWNPGGIWPSDVQAFAQNSADIFLAPTASYAWDALGNGVTITVLKDLRLIAYTGSGLGGSLPGALPPLRTPPKRMKYVHNFHSGGADSRALRTSASGIIFSGNSLYFGSAQPGCVIIDSPSAGNHGRRSIIRNNVGFHRAASLPMFNQTATASSGIVFSSNVVVSEPSLSGNSGVKVVGKKMVLDDNVFVNLASGMVGIGGSNWGGSTNKTSNRVTGT